MPIIKYYEKLNLVKTIPATGTPDEVQYTVQSIALDYELDAMIDHIDYHFVE
jgi:hypothetical protein